MRRRDLWDAVHEERAALVGSLRDVPAERWDTPSLCQGWRVREVVGHLCGIAHQYRGFTVPMFVGTVKAGLRPNRFWDRDARMRGRAAVEELLAELARGVTDRRHPWPAFPLAETVIHGEDIRAPLGLVHRVPSDRLVVVANLLRLPNYPPVRPKPARGLRLEASDADWSAGRGPVVRGHLSDLVLVMAGRPVSGEGLAGDGVPLLLGR